MATPLAKLLSMLTPKRSWLQFSLKWILVLVAISLFGDLASNFEQKRRERLAVVAIKKLGFGQWVEYDWELNGDYEPPGPIWLRNLLGQDFFAVVQGVEFQQCRTLTDAELEKVVLLPNIRSLWLEDTSITNAGLAHLKKLTSLEELVIWDKQITDDGLVHLKGMKNLKRLALCPATTDAGLAHIGEMTWLSWLNLDVTKITDAGLVHLKRMEKLEGLVLTNTQITKSSVAELRKALPNCRIKR